MFRMKGKGEEDESTYMVAVCGKLRILQKPREKSQVLDMRGLGFALPLPYPAVGDQR